MKKKGKKPVHRGLAALLAVVLILTAIPVTWVRESKAGTEGKYTWSVRIKTSNADKAGTDADVHFWIVYKDGGEEKTWKSGVLDGHGDDFERGDNDTYGLGEISGFDPWQITKFGIRVDKTITINPGFRPAEFEVYLPGGGSITTNCEKGSIGENSQAYWDVKKDFKDGDKLERKITNKDGGNLLSGMPDVHITESGQKFSWTISKKIKDQFNADSYHWSKRSCTPKLKIDEVVEYKGGSSKTVGNDILDVTEEEDSYLLKTKSAVYDNMVKNGVGSYKIKMSIYADNTATETKEIMLYRDVFGLELPGNKTTDVEGKFTGAQINKSADAGALEDIYITGKQVRFQTSINHVYGQKIPAIQNKLAEVLGSSSGVKVGLYRGDVLVCNLNSKKATVSKDTNQITFTGDITEKFQNSISGATKGLSLKINFEKKLSYGGIDYAYDATNTYYSFFKIDNIIPEMTFRSPKSSGVEYSEFDELKKIHEFYAEASEQLYRETSNGTHNRGEAKMYLRKNGESEDSLIYNSQGGGTGAKVQTMPVQTTISKGDPAVKLALAEAKEGIFTLTVEGKDVAQNKFVKKVDKVALDNKAPEVTIQPRTQPRALDGTRSMVVDFKVEDFSKTGRVNYCFVREGQECPTPGSQMEEIPASVSEGQWCFVKEGSLSQTTSTVLKIGKEEEFVGTLYYYTVDDLGNDSRSLDQKKDIEKINIELFNKSGAGTVEIGVPSGDEGKAGVPNYEVYPKAEANSKFCYYYQKTGDPSVRTKTMDNELLKDNEYQPGSSKVVMADGTEAELDGAWDFVYYFQNIGSGDSSKEMIKQMTFDTKAPEVTLNWDYEKPSDYQRVRIKITDSSRITEAWYSLDKDGEKISLPINGDGRVDTYVELSPDTADKNRFELVVGAKDENSHIYDSVPENGTYYILSTPETEIALENSDEHKLWNDTPVITEKDNITVTVKTNFKEEAYQELHAQVSYSLDGIIWNDYKEVKNLTYTDGQYQGTYTLNAGEMKLYEGLNAIYSRVRIYGGAKSPQEDTSVQTFTSPIEKIPYIMAYYDSTPPEAHVEYDKTTMTKEDVVLTLYAEDSLTGKGFLTAAGNSLTLEEKEEESGVFTCHLTENTKETITVSDMVGNTVEVPVDVNWIDKTPPTIQATASPVNRGSRVDAEITVNAEGVSYTDFALVPADSEDVILTDEETGEQSINPVYIDYFNDPGVISDPEGTEEHPSYISMDSMVTGYQKDEKNISYEITVKGLTGTYRLAAYAEDVRGNGVIVENLCEFTVQDSETTVDATYKEEAETPEGETLIPSPNVVTLTFSNPVYLIPETVKDEMLASVQTVSDTPEEGGTETSDQLEIRHCKKITPSKFDTVWEIPVETVDKITIDYMDEADRPFQYTLDPAGHIREDGPAVEAVLTKNGEVVNRKADEWLSMTDSDILELELQPENEDEYLWLKAETDLSGFTVDEEKSEIIELPDEGEDGTGGNPDGGEDPGTGGNPDEGEDPGTGGDPGEGEEPGTGGDPGEGEDTGTGGDPVIPGEQEVVEPVVAAGADGDDTGVNQPENTGEEITRYKKLVFVAVPNHKNPRKVHYQVGSLPSDGGDGGTENPEVTVSAEGSQTEIRDLDQGTYLLTRIDETAAPEPADIQYSSTEETGQPVTVTIMVDDPESSILDVTTQGSDSESLDSVYMGNGIVRDTFVENAQRIYTIVNGAGMETQFTVAVTNIHTEPVTEEDYQITYYYRDYKNDLQPAESDKAYRNVEARISSTGKVLTVRNNGGSFQKVLYDSRSFTFQLMDEYGHSKDVSVSHEQYDKNPPAVAAELENTELTKDPVKVKINASDEENDGVISHVEVSTMTDGGKFEALKKIKNGEYELEVGQNGKYLISAYDLAGNRADTTLTVTNINNNAPYLSSYTLTPEGFTSKAVKAELKFKIGEEENDRVYISRVEPASQTLTDADLTFTRNTITFQNSGSVTVYFRDQYGNQGMGVVTVDNIVREAPNLAARVEIPEDQSKAIITFYMVNEEGNDISDIGDQYGRKLSDITVSSSILDYSNKAEGTDGAVYTRADKARLIATENGVYQVVAYDDAGNTQNLGVVVDGIDRTPAKVTSVDWNYNYQKEDEQGAWNSLTAQGTHEVKDEKDKGLLITSRQETSESGQIVNSPATNEKVVVTVTTDKPVTQVGSKAEPSQKSLMDYTDDGTFSFNLKAVNNNITQYGVSVDLIDKKPPVLKVDYPELAFVENAVVEGDQYRKELLTQGLTAYDVGKDGKEIPIDESKIKISYGEEGHVFNPDEIEKNKFDRTNPYTITYTVRDAVGNETTLKQTVVLIGQNDTVALINGRMPSMTNTMTINEDKISVTLKNHGGKAYVKYERGYYTMGEMKTRGKKMDMNSEGAFEMTGLTEGWYTVYVQTDKRDYFTIQVYYAPSEIKN